MHPILKTERLQTGINYRVKYGDSVLSASDGTITLVSKTGSWWNFIEMSPDKRFLTRYAHLSEFQDLATEGKYQEIALAGNYGMVTGVVLHFELLFDGFAIDTAPYLVNP